MMRRDTAASLTFALVSFWMKPMILSFYCLKIERASSSLVTSSLSKDSTFSRISCLTLAFLLVAAKLVIMCSTTSGIGRLKFFMILLIALFAALTGADLVSLYYKL